MGHRTTTGSRIRPTGDINDEPSRRDEVKMGIEADLSRPPSNNFVQDWLTQTQRRPDWESTLKTISKERDLWRPHNLEQYRSPVKTPPQTLGVSRHGRGPMSFDSSLIPDNSMRPPRLVQGSRKKCGQEGKDRLSPGSVCSHSIPRPAPRFERQKRHKTRPDRYDVQKGKRSGAMPGQESRQIASQEVKRTKGNRKKTGVSSREVMSAFKSDAICTQDRLTVWPR